jgi:hypothetical protein
VASYAARVLHPERTKDASVHVLVEQAGISGTPRFRKSIFLGPLFVVSIFLLPVLSTWVSPMLLFTAFVCLAPFFWDAFSIKKFAHNGGVIIDDLKDLGVRESQMEVRGYSLGTLAAAEWFNQYEAKNGHVPGVKMVFDRGPRPDALPEYAKDNFILPGIALFFAFMFLLSGFIGVVPVWVVIGTSLLCVLMLASVEDHKALFARLLYQFTENWVNSPNLDPKNTTIVHATNDITIPKGRRFKGPVKARELVGEHDQSFDGTNMLPHDSRLNGVAGIYHRIIDNTRCESRA